MAIRLPDFTALDATNVYPGSIQPRYETTDPEAEAELQYGAGLQKVGTGVTAISSEAYQSTNLANAALAQLKLHTDVARTKAQIEASNNPEEINQLYGQLRANLDSAAQLIPDSRYRDLWLGHHARDVADAELAAEGRQRTVYKDKFLAGVNASVDDAIKLGSQSDDPAVRQQTAEKLGTLYGALEGVGFSAAEAQAHARKSAERLILGRAQYLFGQNRPGEALAHVMANAEKIAPDDFAHIVTSLRGAASIQLGNDAFAKARGGAVPGEGGPGGSAEAQPSQPAASKNLDNFNFGNMKAVGGGWRTFPSEEEGAKAIGDWLVRHNQGGQTTIRQLIDDPQRGYAPSSDPGNAGKRLPEAAARAVGIGPDDPIDMNDPALRRKMVGAIVQQEFGSPQVTNRALAAYDRVGPGVPGAPPAAVPATPEAVYSATLDRINNDPAVRKDPVAYQHAIAAAEAEYRSKSMLVSGVERAKKIASDAAADTIVKRMMGGNFDGIVEQIANDPALSVDDRKNLWAIADAHVKGDVAGTTKSMGSGIFDVLRRIGLPEGDPNRIQNVSQVLALGQPLPGGQPAWLTLSGVDLAQGQLAKVQHDPVTRSTVEMQNGQLAKAKRILSNEVDFGVYKQRDPLGEDIYNSAFIPAFFKAYDDGIKAGKSPHELLSPESPAYITQKLIDAYKRSDAQAAQDRINAGVQVRDADAIKADIKAGRMTAEQGKAEMIARGLIHP